MKNNRSLTTKFTIALLIILLIGQGVGFVPFILSIRNSLVDSLNEKMRRVGDLLAEISIKPILDSDSILLNTYLEGIFKDEDFVSLTVFDKNKNIIGKKTRFAQKSFKFNPFYVKQFLKNEISVFSRNEKIGNIIITASSKRINNEILKHMVVGVIYQSILSIVVILLVLVFFNRNIKKPLSDLNVAVSKASAGDLTVTIQYPKSLEIAALVKGFNSLIAQLKDSLRKLYSTTNDVAVAIKQIDLIMDRVTQGTHNQAGATAEVILAMESAGESQKEVLEDTQNLTGFSEENLSSLMQIKSTSEEITESSEQLFQSSSDSYSTIAEISSAAKAIAQSTEELSTSTEQITASIEQISANIKEVESGTRESAHLTSTVREIASDMGMLTVADAMGGMDEIIDSVDKTLELVRNLKIKSKDVEKVLVVINDVTKQTNLLSVNAAILAAQAGEYGKGFSVVADEIKTLADRTASSAKEITNIIKAIQKGITEATHVTENSKIIVENGNTLVVRTGEAFREVINSAQKSSEMANTIQKATEEQVKGIVQIKESMEMIMLIVEQVSKATHEHEIGSEHLVSVAEKVKEISEIIKKGMQEQTSGIHLISRNLELTNEKIKHIADATSKYGRANEETLSAAAKIGDICNNTLTIAQEMAASFNTLYQEAEALKRDMERFKLE